MAKDRTHNYLVEDGLPFSQSRIWQLQRDYFEGKGIEAWQKGEVPHYLTSNPVIGKTYAELVLALLKDLSSKGQQNATVFILELGAGPGRLCYHFLKHLEKYYDKSALILPPICYVLSDIVASNIDFWKTHPRFLPYVEKGWLDFTHFNTESDGVIKLVHSGKSIEIDSLEQPIIVIANYLFDTIPQELFRIQEDKIDQVLISFSSNLDLKKATTAQIISSLELRYDFLPTKDPIYPSERKLNKILDVYREKLTNSHILLPYIGIRCLERLRLLSKSGLVLLSADKGDHHLSNLDHCEAPELTTHGSFSLNVNYHALRLYCENEKGIALFPRHQHTSLDLGCLLLLPDASSYLETINAYDKYVQDYGPDDFFMLKKLIEKSCGALTYQDIIAAIRLSGYDARFFQQMLPDLFDQLETITSNERWNLLLIIPRIWDTYFPLREAEDFATNLGNLLLGLKFYDEAIRYYERSILIYGKMEHVLYNIALCYCLLDDIGSARPYVHELLEFNPNNESLKELIERFGISHMKE